MPLIRRSYLDLSPEQRREGAKVVRARITAALGSPGLAPDQIRQLQEQMHKISMWEAGTVGQASQSVDQELLTSFVRRFSAN